MTFDISEDELKQINAWKEKLGADALTAIGGRYEYSFNPTSVGTIITVKDLLTGAGFSPEINW